MEEAARIARGDIKPLSDLKASDFDAVFVPGGFGVAKNLSDFAFKGADMSVTEDVEAALKDFHTGKKYIGLCCISPVLGAKIFGTKNGGPGIKTTFGMPAENTNGAIEAAKALGNDVVDTAITQVCHDEQNKIVSGQAYMKQDAYPRMVFASAKMIVDTVATQLLKTQGVEQALVVNITVKPENIDEFIKVARHDATESRKEEGCFRFDVLQDPEDKTKFQFYEAYRNKEAVESHKNTQHFKDFFTYVGTGAITIDSVKQLGAVDFTSFGKL